MNSFCCSSSLPPRTHLSLSLSFFDVRKSINFYNQNACKPTTCSLSIINPMWSIKSFSGGIPLNLLTMNFNNKESKPQNKTKSAWCAKTWIKPRQVQEICQSPDDYHHHHHTQTHTITRVYILVSIFRQRFCCRQQTQLSTHPSHTYNSIIRITLAFWRTFLQPRLTREATTVRVFVLVRQMIDCIKSGRRLLSPSVCPTIFAEWMEPFLINKCHRFFFVLFLFLFWQKWT
jgi:hypothetical protein